MNRDEGDITTVRRGPSLLTVLDHLQLGLHPTNRRIAEWFRGAAGGQTAHR
jgi:hypothetical protein